MRITNFPKEFIKAIPVLKEIQDAGYEAYFVGGCVRDTLLGIPLHDVDIASSAYPAEIKQIFNRTVDTGIEHGTVMVLDHGEGYEVTTFRTESTYQDFRRPDHVTFVRSLSEDLKRRDLTINALAMGADGTVIDLFNGLEDLKNHIIRAVGDPHERYHEDALRMMRSIRFMSQLDFKLEKNTKQAIKDNASLLSKIAVERIRVELIKMFLGKNPNAGVETFINTDLYKYCPDFPNYQDGLEKIAGINKIKLENETECWVLLGYEFNLNIQQLKQLMRHWKTSRDLINQVEIAYSALLSKEGLLDSQVLFNAGLDLAICANHIAKLVGKEAFSDQKIKDQYMKLPIKSVSEIKVTGTDLIQKLNMKPGPMIGQILTDIKEKILKETLANDENELISYISKNY